MTTEHGPASTTPGRHEEKTAPAEAAPVAAEAVPEQDEIRVPGGWAPALLRIATGFVFLWAFLDKTFGLGYATPGKGAWIHGGSPTQGFLGHLAAGPLRGMFTGWAGAAWADWLFMVGLLGIGVAVLLGVGLRISAVAGSVLMLAMWLAEWPLARVGYTGEPTSSTNPIVDSHIVYALVLIVLAVAYAGRTWGLGRIWERIGVVRRNPWLL